MQQICGWPSGTYRDYSLINKKKRIIWLHNKPRLEDGLLPLQSVSQNTIFPCFFCGVQQALFCAVQCWRTVSSVRRPFLHQRWQPKPGRVTSKVRLPTNNPPRVRMMEDRMKQDRIDGWWQVPVVLTVLLALYRSSRLGAWWSLQLLHCLQSSFHRHSQKAPL